jgi:hypothetical protein
MRGAYVCGNEPGTLRGWHAGFEAAHDEVKVGAQKAFGGYVRSAGTAGLNGVCPYSFENQRRHPRMNSHFNIDALEFARRDTPVDDVGE